MKKIYLGDSVYGDFSSGQVILTTENGMGSSNTIILEPEVVVALVEWLAAIGRERNADG